jgi:hypothetical protein
MPYGRIRTVSTREDVARGKRRMSGTTMRTSSVAADTYRALAVGALFCVATANIVALLFFPSIPVCFGMAAFCSKGSAALISPQLPIVLFVQHLPAVSLAILLLTAALTLTAYRPRARDMTRSTMTLRLLPIIVPSVIGAVACILTFTVWIHS